MKHREYIQEALTKGVIDIFGEDSVVVPNVLEAKEGFHVELHYIPSEVRPITMGDSGEDNHTGLIQVNLVAPFGTGTALTKEKCAQLTGIFKAGYKVWYNNTIVTIQRAQEETSFRRDQWWITPVSIYWYSRVNRG